MINAMVSSPYQKIGGVLKGNCYPGQWCYVASGTEDNNSGELYFIPIANSGQASPTHVSKVFPVIFYPKNNEEQETYIDTTPLASGTRVVALMGGNAMIEDDYVYTRAGDTTFTGALIGELMYLNTSGYPVVGTASGLGTVPVARFMGLEGDVVRYMTLS